MADQVSKSENYRVRAVELRAIAETMKDQGAREALLGISKEYEKMAAQVEQLGLDRLPDRRAR